MTSKLHVIICNIVEIYNLAFLSNEKLGSVFGHSVLEIFNVKVVPL